MNRRAREQVVMDVEVVAVRGPGEADSGAGDRARGQVAAPSSVAVVEVDKVPVLRSRAPMLAGTRRPGKPQDATRSAVDSQEVQGGDRRSTGRVGAPGPQEWSIP